MPGSLRAAPVAARVRLYDLQGRVLRTLHEGDLARGVTRVAWDGRDAAGRDVGAGLYLLRLETPLGSTVTRVLRVR